MHRHLIEVFGRLDDSRAQLRAAVETVPAALRDQRPAPGRWSAAEILEHLALVDERFTSLVGGAIDRAVDAGLGPETGGRDPLPPAVATRLANREEKRTAPEVAQPTGTLDAAAAWGQAERARASFRDTVCRADGLALGSVRVTHGFFGELTIYQWVELVAGHERRHVEQINELSRQLAPAP